MYVNTQTKEVSYVRPLELDPERITKLGFFSFFFLFSFFVSGYIDFVWDRVRVRVIGLG